VTELHRLLQRLIDADVESSSSAGSAEYARFSRGIDVRAEVLAAMNLHQKWVTSSVLDSFAAIAVCA
jgi:hypothetical protein